MSDAEAITIPNEVLEQAFHWAMILGDTHVSPEEQQAFEHWRQQKYIHKIAWQRIQIIEQEFTPARTLATQSSAVLNNLVNKRRNKRTSAVGSALSIMLMLGLSLSYTHKHWRYDYVTGTGEQQEFVLKGGAQVYLGSDTTIDVEYTNTGILLHLNSGQLLVNSRAATGKNKPSIITDFGRFKPIGTRFVVSKLANSSELAVTQGQVQITAGQNAKLALAGERWRVSANQHKDNKQATNQGISGQARYSISKQAANGLAPDAWLDNVIEANNARLGDVLAILSQHHQGWLHYSDEVAQLRVSGVFRLDNTDGALTSLQNSLPIHIERTTNWWLKLTLKP
ncbi:MAG: FecR domain-containing protein [Gammaproteobacteria bacterium]|nr:FecR domain-containing protein [Gammaproteobacteria bacterium]